MPFSKPHLFLPKSNMNSMFPSEDIQAMPDGITKRFLPILTLLRLFGVYPLKFGTVEFGSGNTNKASSMIQYSVNLNSKSCIISMLTGILLNIIFTIVILHGELFGADFLPEWM
jgi:hypothetical protein